MFTRIRRWLRWRLNSLTRMKLELDHPLEYLFLEVTRRCNLRCQYCGSLCTTKEQRPEMPIERWIELLRDIPRAFEPRTVMLAITGGEPLMKKGIFELFDEAGRLGYRFGMVSNGTLLDEAAAHRIVKSGMGSISLSMDGPREVNDVVRGAGAFDGVAQAVENLRAAGYCGILEIMSTVTKPVMPYLEATCEAVRSLDVPRWRLVPVMPIGRAAEHGELVIDETDLNVLLDYVRDYRRSQRQSPYLEFGEEGYLGDEYEGVVRPAFHLCRAGLNVAGVLADGRIGACPELADSFVQGDLAEDDFLEVWESRYEVFRDRSWTKQGLCAECDAWNRCQGGSLHLYAGPNEGFCRCTWLQLEQCKRTATATDGLRSTTNEP